jgi:hypothetical protein
MTDKTTIPQKWLDRWPPRKRANTTAVIPFGYQPEEEGSIELVPNWEHVAILEEACDHLDEGASYRQVADWVSSKLGRTISHQGIANLWKRTRKSKRQRELKREQKAKAPKTKEERDMAAAKRKQQTAKMLLTKSTKKIAELEGKNEPEELQEEEVLQPRRMEFSDTLDFNAKPTKDPRPIIFSPNPGPQTEFLAASEREVLYGGAAGGGKSIGLLADPMRYFANANFNGLILRRTNDELRELIWKSQELYPKAYPGAKWQEKKSQWVFPSGARLWMTYLEREEDVLRYQGQAFSYIGFDELTQHSTPFAWNYMRSRLRTTDPGLPIFMRATTNPGGPGHQWVKQMFIDPAPPNKAFAARDLETGDPLVYPEGHEKEGQSLFSRKFIPATLKDNPYLFEDGAYEANLLSLPEMQRRQLLEGDWAVADGAAFPEFRQSVHVVDPFDIPPDWRRFRSCDFGYSSYSAVHWYAIDPAFETLIVYRELYVSRQTGRDLAKLILDAERGENISYGMLDSSCWHNRGQIGPSIAEEMISMGCRWRPSDRSAGARVAGKNRLHELLKVDESTEVPGIIFFNNCRQIIADLPVIPSDPKGGDDIDVRYKSDHAYDSIRYGIMSRPRAVSPFEDWGKTNPQGYRPASSRFGY